MEILCTIITLLIIPSSSFLPPQYLHFTQPAKKNIPFSPFNHPSRISESTWAPEAKLNRAASFTTLHVSSEEKINKPVNVDHEGNNDLLEKLSKSLDDWILTGTLPSRRRSYDIIQQIKLEYKGQSIVETAIRMATRATMPLNAPPDDPLVKIDKNDRAEAAERKEWEVKRSSATSDPNNNRRVSVHISTGKSAFSDRIPYKPKRKPRVDKVKDLKKIADSKKELEDELARVIPDDQKDESGDHLSNTAPPTPTLDAVEVAEAKTSEIIARAGSGKAFDGKTLGIGGLDNVLSQIKRRIWVPLAAPPSLLKELGINPVRGLLLYGAPGCGKTLLARCLGKIFSPARPITVVSGPEVMDRFVGSSEANLRELFDSPPDIYDTFRIGTKDNGAAISNAALHVIILDEFDAMSRSRGGSGGQGDQGDAGVARDSVVNQLLAKMDGVDSLVVPTLVIGLTNKRTLIDPALLRSGRFEVQIEVPKPKTVTQRFSILNVHLKNMYSAGRLLVCDSPEGTPASRKLNKGEEVIAYNELVMNLAEKCDGMTGASLAGVVRAAASRALERAVYDFAGCVDEGKNDIDDRCSIDECIVTELDFSSAVEDILQIGKAGEVAEDDEDTPAGEVN